MQLRTSRLLLREFCADDFDAAREYDGDPQVQRYRRASPLPEEETRAYLQTAQHWAQQQPRTHYAFAVTLLPDDRAMGRLTLGLNNDEIREWEIGWLVHRAHWGRGIATEAAHAGLRFAFETLNAHRVVAFCQIENTASWRVMEKLGMLREGRIREVQWRPPDGWKDEYVYSILDREWPIADHLVGRGGGWRTDDERRTTNDERRPFTDS